MPSQSDHKTLQRLSRDLFGPGGKVDKLVFLGRGGFSNRGQAWRALIVGRTAKGKVSRAPVRLRTGPMAERSWRVQTALWQAGASVPEPLGYGRSLRMFAYREAPGSTFRSYIEGGKVSRKQAEAMLAAAVGWLRRLPRMRPQALELPKAGRSAWLARLQVLGRTMPLIWRKCHAQLLRNRYAVTRPKFVHGDFQASNLLWRAGKVTAIDFTESFLGDELWDLGYFLAHCEHMVSYHYGARAWAKLAPKLMKRYFGRAATPAEHKRLAWAYAAAQLIIAALIHGEPRERAHYDRTMQRVRSVLDNGRLPV